MLEGAAAAGMRDGELRFFEDAAQAGAYARTIARPGDAVLFKGSRGVRVERALEEFVK
jgi:UDP-N-acetylmuramoyl-tripeptide--D-alanyl-D-alanine ligase